jgi:broad specificity phosphatase PhoE
MRLYFVRHGESEANVLHVISNRETPHGLTPLGRQQASTLANSLRNVPITTIFSSPILRARQTAEILAETFHQMYQVTEALREYDCGILEYKADEESWKLHREIAEDWTLNQNYLRKPEDGECFLDIRNRFIPFVEELTRDGWDRGAHILLVGHGGLFQLMLPLLLTNVDIPFAQSHGMGHTETIIVEQEQNGLVCLQWGPVRFDKAYPPKWQDHS